MSVEWSVYAEHWQLLARGLAMTALIAAASLALSLALGFGIAIVRLFSRRLFRTAARMHLEAVRNLPFIVLLYLCFFGLPVAGIAMPATLVGILALTVYGSAHFAEIFRGALQSVARGHWDAARALGLSDVQMLQHVLLPQMLRRFIASATRQAVMLIKESAVLSTIAVLDLTGAAQLAHGLTGRALEVFVAAALLYWLLTEAAARAGAALEARLQPRSAVVRRVRFGLRPGQAAPELRAWITTRAPRVGRAKSRAWVRRAVGSR